MKVHDSMLFSEDPDGIWKVKQLSPDLGHIIEKDLNPVSRMHLIASNRRRKT